MSATFKNCPGCGNRRLMWPGGHCIDCRDGVTTPQLAFDLEDAGCEIRPSEPETQSDRVIRPAVPTQAVRSEGTGKDKSLRLKKNPQAGAPRLLRTLLARGLDPAALDVAAGLVALLDADAREPMEQAA
jgi:hypothetical protein